MVLTTTNGAITAITGFRDPTLFDVFELPAVLD
jgi:hypothetical protein